MENKENFIPSRNNLNHIPSSEKSVVTFSLPASRISPKNKTQTLDKNIEADDGKDQHQSKRFCGKLSPGPSSFNTQHVKSTFEKGESSKNRNLLNEFNDVDDDVSIDSDTTCGGTKAVVINLYVTLYTSST